MGSIHLRGTGVFGERPSLSALVWKSGRFARDFAAGALAPIVARTNWRQSRLLILGYHGVSVEDEHLWDGAIYMSREKFRRRLQILKQGSYQVLPLQTGLRRLEEGTLPARAVSFAFDDGFHDFASIVTPMLAEFGFPATVFLSTYYAQFNRPVFDVMLCYLLWKGAHKTLELPGILESPADLNAQRQQEVRYWLLDYAFQRGLSGLEKDKLLEKLAQALAIDYDALCRKRLLHLMNPEEVRQVLAAGHEIQLHTHRHRVSRRRDLFEREITDNRQWITQTLGSPPATSMSFPGDAWQPVEQQWMRDLGVESAITCRPALADTSCEKLWLPRFMDNQHVPERVFRAWLAGSMSFFPMAEYRPPDGQILEDTVAVDSQKKTAAAAGGC